MADTKVKIVDIQVNVEQAQKQLAAWAVSINDAKEAQKKLKKQLDEGVVTQRQYQEAMARHNTDIRQMQSSAQSLSRAIQNSVKVQLEQEGSLNQLRAALSLATQKYDALGAAERNSASGQELKEHINGITASLKGVEEATGRTYRNIGNYGQSVADALSGLTDLKGGLNGLQTGIPAIDTKLRVFGDSFTVLGKSVGGVIPNIKALGSTLAALVTNPVFLALAGVAGAGTAFKWWFDYNKGLAEATRLTGEFLGVAGDELTAIRSRIAATADVWGKDYKEVLGAVDGLMAQYGVSADEAMGIVQDGFAAGADEGRNMLGLIRQYAPSFHDAGIGADELVAIIQQTRSGIFNEQGLSLIQTAAKRIREMSDSTRTALEGVGVDADGLREKLSDGSMTMMEAIQLVSVKMRDFGTNSGEVGDILKEVFGRAGAAGGTEMIKALADLDTGLESVKQTTGEWGELQQRQVDAQTELNNVTAALFDMTQDGFEEMGIKIKTYAIESLAGLMRKVVEIINYFIDLYNESTVVRGGVEAIKVDFQALWNTVKLVFGFIVDTLKGAAKSLRGFASIVEGIVTLNWDKVKGGFASIGTAYSDTFREMTNDFAEFGYSTAKAYMDAFNNTVNGAKVEHIKIPSSGDIKGGAAKPGAKSGAAGQERQDGNGDPSGDGQERQDAKAAQKKLKEENEAIAAMLESRTALYKDSYEKQRRMLEDSAAKEIAKLRQKLATEENLTETARAAIGETIKNRQAKLEQDLAALEDKYHVEDLKRYEGYVKNRLAVVEKGSEEEQRLRLEQAKAQYDEKKAARDTSYRNGSLAAQQDVRIALNGMDAATTDADYDAAVDRYQQALERLRMARESYEAEEAAAQKSYEDEAAKIRGEYQLKALNDRLAAIQQELDVQKEGYNKELQASWDRYRQLEEDRKDDLISEEEYALKKKELLAQISEQTVEQARQYGERQKEETGKISYGGIEVVTQGKMEELRLQKEADEQKLQETISAGQMEGETTEEYSQRVSNQQQQAAESNAAYTNAMTKNQQAYGSAMQKVGDSVISIFDAMGEDNKALAKAGKIIALANIAISTGESIANVVKSASAAGWPAMIPIIATGIATVMANIATAISTVKSASFAKGGKVVGPGTGTSDSITAQLSNGEYVMTARATKMFEPLLAAMNGIGAGAPMQVSNSYREVTGVNADSMADGFAQAAMKIRPVVSVQEINKVQERVEVIENLDNL